MPAGLAGRTEIDNRSVLEATAPRGIFTAALESPLTYGLDARLLPSAVAARATG